MDPTVRPRFPGSIDRRRRTVSALSAVGRVPSRRVPLHPHRTPVIPLTAERPP